MKEIEKLAIPEGYEFDRVENGEDMSDLCGNAGNVQPKQSTLDTCHTCVHRQRWECGSKVISYCRVRKSNRTFNGLQKVKCNQQACSQYTKIL